MVSKGGDITWTNQEQPNSKSEAPGDKTWHGLRTVVLEKGPGGFGFTLRHFVVYPPDTVNAARLAGKHPTVVDPTWDQHKQEAMDTIFVREVRPGSAADRAGLVTGDRIVSINGQPVTGRSYGQVIELIHKCGPSLQLLVVPKEDDILQLYFASSAYQPVRRLPQPLWSAETTRAESSPLRTTLANTSALSRCGASEPTSPVHCLAGTHFRPVNPARRLFFGLDPEPATTATTTAPTIEGTAFGLTSQPMSLSYPSYGANNGSTNASSNDPRRGAAGVKMPPSTSVPTCLGGQTRFAPRSDDGWHGQTDSGIGSVEEGEPKQTAAATTTTTTTTMSAAVQHHQTALPEQSSLNLVAQRLHLFESGGLLARSLERMKLYRSELARLTSGCPVPIVSVRAARFEEMDGEGRKETASETSSLSVGGAYDRLLPLSSPTSRVPSFDRSPDSPLQEERPFASLPDQSTLSGYADGADDVGLEEGGAYQMDGYISVTSDDASAVVYRRKNGSKEDKAHPARRTSYLRATANERLHLESDHSEDEQHSISSTSSTPSGSHRIQKLKAFFGDKASSAPSQASEVKNGTTEDPEITGDVQGWLACKTVLVDGKRSSDRSWRPVWLVLRGDKVYILKDRKTIDFGEGSHLSLRTSMSDVARDYTKRKHVFRLRMESGTEYLFQADNHSNMIQWVEALRQITNEDSEVEDILSDRSVLEKAAAFEQGSSAGQGRLSPMPVVRPVKKLAFRHRSPNSGSPRVKSRRASLGDEPSLKAVHMWRGKVVHSWKRLHGSLASLPPKGHSIGVPLHECPPSLDNQYVPWLVSLCTRVVEAKGLETVGVYRIPGNSAAVAALSAAANGGLDQLDLGDPRWGDVHVVSSLLKAFFRQLPDPLAGRYARFIAAARGTQGTQRLAALRALVHELPIHNFETLKFLMQHLKKVVAHSTTNKMEARNLAIVFGPTLVRTADNSMLTMITDMSHQCHITEALINYADYVFGDLEGEDGLSSVPELPLDVAALPLSDTDSSVLIDNLHKVGSSGQGSGQEVCTRDLVSSLVSAANRKLRQRKMSLTTEGAVLKPGSRVKDKIMAFEGKGGEEGPKAASLTGNGSVLVAMALPEGATSCSYPPSPTRTLGSPPQTPSVCSEDLTVSSLASGSASPRTYGQLSALAQQKVRFLEAETRAQLRASQRSWPPPQGCPSGQEGAHKREQIERDWQRAKQELEQDDLLDFLADDPSAFLLSHLGQQGTLPMLPPAPAGLSGPANPTPGSTSSTSSPGNNAGEAFAASPRRGDTPPPCAAATPENPPKAPSRATTSRHEKENIPQAGPASPCEPAPVTYRCKKHCLNGASRYAIYRVDDDAEALRQQQRRSENGVVAAVLSGDGVVLAAAATTTTTRRRPLSSMGLQRRHTIGSSRDVKFHPFPTPTSSSFRRVPSGQRLDEGEAWKRLGGARVASPV